MKKMWDAGYMLKEIAATFNTSISTVYDIFNLMCYSAKKTVVENLTYAVKSNVKFEKVKIDGKVYTDITPIFSPR